MANSNNNNIFGLKNLPKNIAPAANVPTANLLGLNVDAADGAAAASRSLAPNLTNLAAPFDAAFFFDNDSKYIEQLRPCGKIKTHKVAGRDYLFGTPIGGFDYRDYMRRMNSPGEEFGQGIARLIASQAYRGMRYEENIDFGSGIAPLDIAVLKTWLEEHRGKKLAILIDYDRTLTQVEGSYFLGNSFDELKKTVASYGVPSDTLTIEGFVEYYTGGTERMEMLQEMFDLIYSTPNVSVYILTNNPACFTYAELFTDVIKILTKGRPFGLLCSARTGGNKRVAIQQGDPMLKGLCSSAGGRRVKKTRRHHKKRKVTRRR